MVIGVLQAINKKRRRRFSPRKTWRTAWTLSHQVAIALENAHLYAELKETFLNTAEALAAAVEKRDPYTGGHIKRVVEYSMAIAKHMPVPLTDMEDLRLAAVLHDIGKIGIKDSVLLKEARLDHEEIAHMREHPLVGEDILVHIEQMKERQEDPARPSRTMGRHRLSRRAEGRRYPVACQDHCDRRHVRRDHDRPALPQGGRLEDRGRGDQTLLRQGIRSRARPGL